MKDTFMIRYYRDCDFSSYPHLYFQRDDGYRTGTMPTEQFQRLKSDLAEHGMLNPITVEWMEKERPNNHGGRLPPQLAVNLGNNRAEAMHQLGQPHGPVLFVIPRDKAHLLPEGGETIPIDGTLLSRLRMLWCDVYRARENEDEEIEIGYADAWSESNLLLQLVWETLPNGPNSLKIERRRQCKTE